MSRSFTGDANMVFFTAISTPPAPNLLSFLFMISYPESDGNIAESLMVLSSFDWHTHNISGLCSFNKVDKSACLLSDTRLGI